VTKKGVIGKKKRNGASSHSEFNRGVLKLQSRGEGRFGQLQTFRGKQVTRQKGRKSLSTHWGSYNTMEEIKQERDTHNRASKGGKKKTSELQKTEIGEDEQNREAKRRHLAKGAKREPGKRKSRDMRGFTRRCLREQESSGRGKESKTEEDGTVYDYPGVGKGRWRAEKPGKNLRDRGGGAIATCKKKN